MSEPTVPPELYSRVYYETECQGHEEFLQTRGARLPGRLMAALALRPVRPGMQVLDIGTGRGEVALHLARQGATAWAMDYSSAGLGLARELLQDAQGEVAGRVHLLRANARRIPFPAERFDLIYMLDLVEHLYPHELRQVLADAGRVLKPDGAIIVHTMPNTWYYRVGYPLFRWFTRLRGEQLPADPRDRWQFVHQMHINEQSPIRLRRSLREAGLRARVWLEPTQTYSHEDNRVVRAVMKLVTRVFPLKYVFCNDIFAIAEKCGHANSH